MSNQPTPKHREEAEELVAPFRIDSCDWTDYPETELTNRIATALSTRDVEIREVLEGLVTHVDFDDGGNPIQHWCAVSDDGDSECDDACLAARGLWDRL